MADWLQTLLKQIGMGSDEDPYAKTNQIERDLGISNTDWSTVPRSRRPRTEDIWLSSPGAQKPAKIRATTPMDTIREIATGDYLANKASDYIGEGPVTEALRLATPDPTDFGAPLVAGPIYRFKDLANAGMFERVGKNIPSVFHATEVRKPFKLFRGAYEGQKNPSFKGSQPGNVSTGISPDVGYHVVNEIAAPKRQMTVEEYQANPLFRRWANNAPNDKAGAGRMDMLAEAIRARAQNTRDPFSGWGQEQGEILDNISRGLRRFQAGTWSPPDRLADLIDSVYGSSGSSLRRQATQADFDQLLEQLLPWINTSRKRTIPITFEPEQLINVRTSVRNKALPDAKRVSPDEITPMINDIKDDLEIRRGEIESFPDDPVVGRTFGEERLINNLQERADNYDPEHFLYERPLEDIVEVAGYNTEPLISERILQKYNMPSVHVDGNTFDGDKTEFAFNNLFTPAYSSLTGRAVNRAGQKKVGKREAAPIYRWWE